MAGPHNKLGYKLLIKVEEMSRKLAIVVLLLMVSCTSDADKHAYVCQPPNGFSEATVVGTWLSGYDRTQMDKLIIREDGLYKQIIRLEAPSYYDYESEWLPWSIKYAENGVAYVHLVGWNKYGFTPHLISENGEDRVGITYIDFCQFPSSIITEMKVYVGSTMPVDEGIFTVMSTLPQYVQPPRGISLSVSLTDITGWDYHLEHD